MLERLWAALFGCSHKNVTWPLTLPPGPQRTRVPAARITGTYIVCTDCGQEFPYSWPKMRVLEREAAAAVDVEPVASLLNK